MNRPMRSPQGRSITSPVSVTFREKLDGTTLITVELDGTSGNIQHPVHLHLGNISVDGSDVAALLTPVTGSTGKSETIITQLSDDSKVSYAQLIALDACIKVHLAASGPDKDIILAGGNIGKAASDDAGRVGFGSCKSETQWKYRFTIAIKSMS